jgi:hypothetical protein
MAKRKNGGGNSHDRAVRGNNGSTGRKPERISVKPATPSAALKWLRGVGMASILFGGFGVMQTFFWPSVIAIYAGFLLLLIDLYLEDFYPRAWTKIPLAAGMLVLAILFTKVVVLRGETVIAVYRVVNGRLDVIVQNVTGDDYQDMDFKIRPDFPVDFVSDPKQITTLSTVSFVDPMPFASTMTGESIETHIDTEHPDDPQRPMTNFLRIRCDKLPAKSSIEVSMSLTQSRGKEDIPVQSVSKVELDGHYSGKFRSYELAEKAIKLIFPSVPGE